MKNSIIWGWLPETIKASAAAIEKLAMIRSRIEAARVETAERKLDRIRKTQPR